VELVFYMSLRRGKCLCGNLIQK